MADVNKTDEKIKKLNSIYMSEIFLKDPETGEDLRPFTGLLVNDDRSYCFKVENKDGSRKWMHTIITEEI